MVGKDGQVGQGMCLFLPLQSSWLVHPSGIHQGTEGGKYIVPKELLLGAKSQIRDEGNMDAVGAIEVPQVEWNHVIQDVALLALQERGLLVMSWGDLGPICCVSRSPSMQYSVTCLGLGFSGLHWSPRSASFIGSKAF